MRLAINRLISRLHRAEQEFSNVGIDTLRFGCLDTKAIDAISNLEITNFNQFQHVIVTSPEAMNHLIRVVTAHWPQWPEDQFIWVVGQTTALAFQKEFSNVRVIHKSGSVALIPVIQKALNYDARVLVACGIGSGRQFQRLNQCLAKEVTFLELYQTVPVCPTNDLTQVTHILHGSAACVKSFLELNLSADHLIHIVTSDKAKSYLPLGSRYYEIKAPTVEEVLHVIGGETSVKQ